MKQPLSLLILISYNGKRYTDSTYYIALLFRKDKPEPELIKLFEKKQLDSLLINKWKR